MCIRRLKNAHTGRRSEENYGTEEEMHDFSKSRIPQIPETDTKSTDIPSLPLIFSTPPVVSIFFLPFTVVALPENL